MRKVSLTTLRSTNYVYEHSDTIMFIELTLVTKEVMN